LKRKRKLVKIGSGTFSTAMRVTHIKNKKTPLHGKIIKLIKGSKNPIEIKRIKENLDEYIICLKKAGINIVETKIKTLKYKDKYQILIIQPEINQASIFAQYIQNCSKSETISILNNLLEVTRKIEYYNLKHTEKIGFDFSPYNVAITEKGIAIFDFYPACIEKEKNPLLPKDTFSKRRGILKNLKSNLMPKRAIIKTISRRKHFMNMDSQRARIFAEFIKKRPELEEVFEKMVEDYHHQKQ
jgi:hypothetical protein